jgi:hypothetical protein
MKKFFAVLLVLGLMFSFNAAYAKSDDDGGPGNDKDEPVMQTIGFAWDKDKGGSWDRGRADSFSLEKGKTINIDILEKCNFNNEVILSGTTINGQAQLPIQIAYFDADKTILGQGGIQIQAGYVQGGASYLNEQGFENEMIFEGLTMRQVAFQSSASEGTPTSFKTSMTKETSFSLDKTETFKVSGSSSEYSKGTWYKNNNGSFDYTGPAKTNGNPH